MEWSKAKLILLIVLAVLNVFLLGTLAYQSYTQESYRDAAKAASEYYAAMGIELDEDIIPSVNLDRTIMIIERSSDLEAAAAKALLRYGAISGSVGGSVTYKADMGSVTWRSGGALDAVFTAPGSGEKNRVEALGELLAGAGIVPDSYIGSETELLMNRECLGLPVYNNTLTASFSDGHWHINGKWYLGEPIPANSQREHDAAGLIVTFADELQNAGVGISHIDSIEAGWISGLVSNVGVKLTPTYKIETDIGVFYINVIDGGILTAE